MRVLARLKILRVIVAEELVKEVAGFLLNDVAKGATIFVLKGRKLGWDNPRHGVKYMAPGLERNMKSGEREA